jgi:hypothetical protein
VAGRVQTEWHLGREHLPPDFGERRNARRQLGRTTGVVVLVGVMSLTSWVIASLSIWLVPVYVAAMVLILVVPRSAHLRESRTTLDRALPELIATGADRSRFKGTRTSTTVLTLSKKRRVGSSSPTVSAAELLEEQLRNRREAADEPASTPLPLADVAKSRKPRSRGRKPGRPSGDPNPSSSAGTAVTWLRVGPGKFVRADSYNSGQPSGPELHTTLPTTGGELSTLDSGLPLELAGTPELEPAAELIPADALILASERSEPEPSPETEVSIEKTQTDLDSHANPSTRDSEPDTDETALWRESDSATYPEITEVDRAYLSDRGISGQNAGEHGITPSTLDVDPWVGCHLEADLEPRDFDSQSTACVSATALIDDRSDRFVTVEPRLVTRSRPAWLLWRWPGNRRTSRFHHSGLTVAGPLQVPGKPGNSRHRGYRDHLAARGLVRSLYTRARARRWVGRTAQARRGFQPRSPPWRL